jgi:hypothetical protein
VTDCRPCANGYHGRCDTTATTRDGRPSVCDCFRDGHTDPDYDTDDTEARPIRDFRAAAEIFRIED